MFTAEERRQYIGGSDIAAVMNMSRWKTPLKLWLEKTGEVEPEDLSQNEKVQLGTELEEFVAQKFSRETGKQVRKQTKMYVHKDYPFMVAHVDRLITGTDEILECKTCGSYKEDEWAEVSEIIEENGKKVEKIIEKVPVEYVLQVIWYLGITGKRVAHIAVLIGGQKFKKRIIEFDKELFDLMVETAKDFWHSVQTKTPPCVSANDNEVLTQIFPTHNDELLDKPEFEDKVTKIKQLKAEITVLTDEKDMLETELKSTICNHLGLITQKYKVTWKEQSQTKIDSNKLKADGLYEKYSFKTSFRKLNISENKKAA